MHISDQPSLIAIPFANNAGGSYIRPIPVPSQIGITTGAASFHDGFPPTTFTPLSGGGAYVNGEDVNGILNFVTQWTRWLGVGAPVPFSSIFSAAVSGYPKYATVPSVVTPGVTWMSTVDANVTDPDGGSPAGWIAVGPQAASLAEVQAGTIHDKFVAPDTLEGLFANAPAGAIGNMSISLPGGLVLCIRDFTVAGGTNTTHVPHGNSHVYSSWARVFVSGGDSHTDPSTCAVAWSLSDGTIFNHSSGAVSCTMFSIGY